MATPQRPSVGRIVRFVPTGGGEASAAIVTGVPGGDMMVNLKVFPDTQDSSYSVRGVPFDEGRIEQSQTDAPVRQYSLGTWHWPERT